MASRASQSHQTFSKGVFPVLLLITVAQCSDLVERKTVNILLLTPSDNKYLFSIQRVYPALRIALDKVQNDPTLLTDRKLVLHVRDSECTDAIGMNYAIQAVWAKQVDAFVGPVCDYVLAPIIRQANFWNLPLISPGANAWAFISKRRTVYPLLTRVGPVNNPDVAKMFRRLMEVHKWRKIKLIYERAGRNDIVEDACHFFMEVLIYHLNQTDHVKVEQYKDKETLLRQEIGLEYSVIVLCASPHAVREIMIKAHELNFDNGEYVFFNMDLFTRNNSGVKPWYNASDTEERNQKARKAYQSLMTVTLRKPTNHQYKEFSQQVKSLAENFTYGEEEVNSFVGAFHDAVILYAIALNESLAANGSISNGTDITRRMWNRTFTGITGNVSIDENGDRNADYSLLDMDPTTNTFRVVANYYGNKKEYEPVKGVKIHWAGGRSEPPPDTPLCGFDGSKCPPKVSVARSYPVAAPLVAFLCVLSQVTV